jgi:hemin uptake protein HemP
MGSRADATTTISSAALLAGARELLIRHGDEEYRLRLTANNKLILTK